MNAYTGLRLYTQNADSPVKNIVEGQYQEIYESFSDVGEIRVWFASKILTPCRMH